MELAKRISSGLSTSSSMNSNHRLQATHKSATPFSFFLASGAALLCA